MSAPAALRQSEAPPPFAEFGIRSNFSFLEGASHPEELAVVANRLGYHAFGIADRNTVSGTVRGWLAAREAGLTYHPGCRLVFSDNTPDMLAYPRNRKGWGHLCRMLTAANLRGEKGAPHLLMTDLLEWGEQMSLALLPGMKTTDELQDLLQLLQPFKGALRLAFTPDYRGDDRYRLEELAQLALQTGTPLMATNDALYHAPGRRPLQDMLTATRLNTTIANAGFALAPNAERHLKSAREMARLFRGHEYALEETLRFESELQFSFEELKYNYPDEATGGRDPQEELERLAWEGAARRWPQGTPEKVRQTLQHELNIVAQMNYARYFLTVNDIVAFARSRGILCQGRGSAANSIICFCLGITDVGPDIIDHLFERFISPERNEPPDIDVDFEHERRPEIIAYIYEKYSARRTALAASVVTYRARSALREVAKAMGLSEDAMAALSGSIWGWSTAEVGEREAGAAGLDQEDPLTNKLMALANQIMGFPRHLSQHVGGFVITRDRLDEIVPIVQTAMEERKMVEWDKDDLEALGILKVDILALGMLTCLKRAFTLLEDHYDLPLSLADISSRKAEEGAVYDMICRADTIGVFQIESRAQMSMLPRLRPREFYDLVIEVAIVRPGPIQGDMVHPYLRRREGKEQPEYLTDEMRNILGKTLGVPLFQEQAMRIAVEAGGFSPGEADKLRRAMATFRRVGTIGAMRQKMIDGMVSRGYPRDFAERCFRQIEGFGEYGFPESHAASFALLVYASCWFKAYYPDIFCAAILNSQPMGFYAPAQLVRDAREHGVEVREVDINHSDWDCLLEEADHRHQDIARKHAEMRATIRCRHAVRLGFRQIKGLSRADMEKLVARRGGGYDSVRDLWLRSGLTRSVLARLAEADTFRSLGLDRRSALWAVQALDPKAAAEGLPLFQQDNRPLRDHEPEMRLPTMPLGEHVVHDYRAFGLSLKAHPVSFLRAELHKERVLPTSELENTPPGRRVAVSGLVLIRQRPGSAKGVIFITIEDETGSANLIVWPKTFELFRPQILGARFIKVTGKLQKASGVIHVVADKVEDLSIRLSTLVKNGEDIDTLMQTDEVKRPVAEDHRARPTQRTRRIIMEKARQETEIKQAAARSAAGVMPKGRNFH
ncbi:error-prone DNA polymerase [Nitratireductor basaltis]|uniref:Error-prone DNA polymerase n=1 Tax=Nitratireductor basaltis TaxID=472175 RepID=A0A084U6E3_9HYPH|nr:error-prone DNA polymerase [Nitratireductor basaltis]KFB08529.1 Error-prone DNA polymerase [Nitratireductor basaltis]